MMARGKKKILIIEDYQETSKMLAEVLKSAGLESVTAGDAIIGLEKAVTEKPDLILLDVMMPQMGGLEACRKLKLDPKTRNIPVIFVTVKQLEEDLNVGAPDSADAYVHKPLDPEHLLSIIATLLR